MKQPKPSGFFLSTSNLFVARLHNSSLLGFPGLPWSLQPRKAPFISKASWPICKYFAVTEGQEKPGLAIFCWAQQALCPALTTLQQVRFLGRCFVDQTYLELTWSWSKHPLPVTPHWLWRGLAPGALGERENRSHTWNCTGLTWAVPGFKPSHLLLGLLCLCTRRTVWNTDRDSIICAQITHRGFLSPAFYLLPLQHLTACLGQATSFCSSFNPPPILYQHQV